MPRYLLTVEGEATETYGVEAADEAEARAIFEDGRSGPPITSEVQGAEVVAVEEESA